MNLLYYVIIFLYGLILGSFYNVVALRIPAGESIVKPRSHCPKCGHTLGAFELIPVLSYILQRGKCRSCRAFISPLYLFTELTTGLLFAAAPFLMGWTGELFVAWTLISLCVIVFVSDYTYMLIPDKVLLAFLPIIIIERFLLPLLPWWDSLLGAAFGFCLLLFIAVISKGGVGGGDIKLFGILGLVLGLKLTMLTFFLATLFGAVFGAFGVLIGKLMAGKPIPFGPFIVIGALITYFYGEQILNWYFQLFL